MCVEIRLHLIQLGKNDIYDDGLNTYTFINMEECYERSF